MVIAEANSWAIAPTSVMCPGEGGRHEGQHPPEATLEPVRRSTLCSDRRLSTSAEQKQGGAVAFRGAVLVNVVFEMSQHNSA